MDAFGQWLEARRKERRGPTGRELSQQNIADKAFEIAPDVQGVSQVQVSAWERGKSLPSPPQLSVVLAALSAFGELTDAEVREGADLRNRDDHDRAHVPPAVRVA